MRAPDYVFQRRSGGRACPQIAHLPRAPWRASAPRPRRDIFTLIAAQPPPRPPSPPPTAEVLGIPLAVSDYDRVLDWMQATIAARAPAYVTAAAVNLVMSAQEDPVARAAVLGATLAVPDGQPLVWALRALGHSAATRVSGPDLLVGVGAAFDFHAGLVPQAPRWMQRAGLEWSYRLAHEPRRLWPRYARYNPRFIAGFARQYVRHLREGRR